MSFRERLARCKAAFVASFAIVHLAGPSPASGQAADSPIVVTARRIEEPIDQTPMSVAALDAQGLERIGAATLADVARAIPNFTLTPTGVLGVETPVIRGIFSPAGSSTVGLYLDDVPIQIRSTGFSRNIDLRTFDLERVEVMRGPQGTVFGANSMGGTIRFITRRPDLARTQARASAELAATDGGGFSHEVQGALGGPIAAGTVGFRAAVYHRTDAGYVDRISREDGSTIGRNIDDHSVIALRGTLRAAIGERIELMPALLYQRGRRDDYSFFDSDPGPYRQRNVNTQPSRDRLILPSLTVTFDVDDAVLTSVTALLDRDDRQVTDYSLVFGELVLGGAMPGLVPEGGTRSFSEIGQRNVTQEIRLASKPGHGSIDWVAGAFLRVAHLDLLQEVVEPGIVDLVRDYIGASVEEVFGVPLLEGGISYRGIERLRERQLAGFGEVNWRFLDGLEASAGVRVARSRLNLRVLSEGPYAGGVLTEPARRSQRETPVTPRFGLSYQPAPGRLIYLSAGKGFRIGGANPPVPTAACAGDLTAFGRREAPVSYGSDTLWSYEAGMKASLARQRVQLSAALFQIDWRGIQQPILLPNCGFSFVDNLGAARSRGFEAEVDVRPVPNLLLYGAIGFVDARFRTTVLGGASGPGGQRAVLASRGDRVPFVPRWSGRFGAEVRARLARLGRMFLRTEYQFASAFRRAPSPVAFSYDPLVYRGAAYGAVQARMGLEHEDWKLSLFVRNLLNDRSILFSSAEFVPVTGSPLRQTTLRPRTIGLAASIQF